MTAATTVPLSRLRFGGDYPGGSIDARKTRSEEGLPELLASILSGGLIYPLIVKRHENGKIYVAEGNRRLAAMRLGARQKRLAKDFPVRIEEMAGDVDPLELSLTANIMRLPMHEVDQYEAFVALRDAGNAPAEIASRFGTSELVVNRRLALGSLSPKLRQAWREDRIRAEAAMAFTVVQDHALQDEVYSALGQGQNLHRHSIIRALTRSDVAGDRDLRFVGREAYVAAGGRLIDDLFVEEAHVLDPEILKRLEREKVGAAAAALVSDGWAWAALGEDLPVGRHSWTRIQQEPAFTEEELFRQEEIKAVIARRPEDPAYDRGALVRANAELADMVRVAKLRAYTPEEKAASGCVLTLTYEGTLAIAYGFVRPASDLGGPLPTGTPAAAEDHDGDPAEATTPEVASPEISGALAGTVSEWLTSAAANALADEPDLALRVLLAAFQCFGSPARLGRSGWSGLSKALKDDVPARQGGFAEALEMALRSSMPHLKAAIAAQVASSLDLTIAAAFHPAQAVKGGRALVDALDAEGFLKAARQAFDAGIYFDRAPLAVSLAAIEEMGGKRPGGKKGVVAATAGGLARSLGWLPPDMRSSHYVPPRAPGAPPAAAAAAEENSRGRRAAPAPAHA